MSKIFIFLLLLVPLVVIHELGHFLMCKLGGIRVTQFAFGFGKRLFGFKYKGTDYRWNLLPLGGYVDFMGELIYTGEIPDDNKHFYHRPKWLRFLVLVMGPLFNMILAFGIFWAYHGVQPYLVPVYPADAYTVGYVEAESPEALAGLREGDIIQAIDGKPLEDHDKLREIIALSPNREITLQVMREGKPSEVRYTVATHKIDKLGRIFFHPSQRVMVGQVLAETPAQRAGLQSEDIITHVNDRPVVANTGAHNALTRLIGDAGANEITLTIEREGRALAPIRVKPEKKLIVTEEGKQEERWQIGISYGGEVRKVDLNWKEAFFAGWREITDNSTLLFHALRKLIIGQLSISVMSGPVGVAQAASQFFDYGIWPFIWFMAVISLQLGILNLLPIPVLDGGEIFVLLVEGISRKEFSLDTKMKIKMVGLFFLIGLMSVIIVNDIIKVVRA